MKHYLVAHIEGGKWAGERIREYGAEENVCALGYGYIGARNDTTQQSRQTPDKEVKGKAIPLQACTGPEGFRRLRLTDF
jgi:hypothetical protein